MDKQPANPPANDSTNPTGNVTPTSAYSGSSTSKEVEGIGLAEGFKDLGVLEVELPKEVAAVGVTKQPTTVTLPPNLTQMGVKTTGPNVPLGNGATVTLPLSDDQIEQGLRGNITSSWRWLAEWCRRKLKQIHLALKSIHGKIMRVSS